MKNTIDEQALNKKLAEWLFPYPEFSISIGMITHSARSGIWIKRLLTEEARLRVENELGKCVLEVGTYYHHEIISGVFTKSLDACEELLMPLLEFYMLDNQPNSYGVPYHAVAQVNGVRRQQWAGTPALAFCLAVEMAIDRGVK